MKQDEDKARSNSKMESTVRELPEIVEETTDQDGQEGTEIQYSSWDMVEYTWDEHHSKSMRACLQFCYLFPQDYEFQKNHLILLWIAEKLLSVAQNETPAYSELVDRGSLYFEQFEEMNVFILSSIDHSTHLQRYKLNKSVFHLLQQQHDDAYFRVDDTNSYASDNTLHSSIYDSSIDANTLEKLYHAKRLCTLLMLHESGSKLDLVPREVFLKLPWISVLDLSGTNIKEVPSSIGKLKNLRYLNLSGTPIVRLPESVCSLHQMRILNLKGCLKLVSLPKGMRSLVKLQYLDVDVARLLVSMPPGFGDLTDLHHLPAFVVGKENGCCITELKEMVNLHGTLRILRLENVSNSEEAADATIDTKKHVVKLQLQWTEFQDGIQFEVLQNLQPYIRIEELQIVGFPGLEFPSWIGDPQFSKLVKVTLHNCRKCKRLPPLGKLPFLKNLFTSDMYAVQAIDTLFCGRDMVGGLLGFKWLVVKATTLFKDNNMFLAFSSLENLTLNGMPALEKWIGIERGDFHHLQKLIITCCSKLTSLPELSLLMSLKQLEISLCASLKSFPNKGLPTSLQCLVIMDCPLLKKWCLEESKLERGKLAGIPNIWIDDQQISLNTEVSDSGRNLTARPRVYETSTRENKQMEESLVNHGKNKKQLNMNEMIFGKKWKGLLVKYAFENISKSPQPGTARVPPSSSRFSKSPLLSSIGSLHLNMGEVMKATQNFSPLLKIGEGGFGTVYKAQLPDGQVVVMKRLKKELIKTQKAEFSSEFELLAKIEHRFLEKLLGYVDGKHEKIIITEHVPNGTLREHLDGVRHGIILEFSQRLEILIDVAHALTYLHLYAEKQIIHGDINSSNILLTESFRAKVADFGFGRLEYTPGYIDPEYLLTNQLTDKSDVFSFGILMIEILTGRCPVEPRAGLQQRITARWVFKSYSEGNVVELLDPLMNETIDAKILSKMFGLAFHCAAPSRLDRPEMKEVGEQLWGIRMDLGRVKKEIIPIL